MPQDMVTQLDSEMEPADGVQSAGDPPEAPSPAPAYSYVRRGRWSNVLVRVGLPAALDSTPAEREGLRPGEATARERREVEDQRCVGGLRSPWRTTGRSPALRAIGARIRKSLELFLDDHPDVIDLLLDSREKGWAQLKSTRGSELVERIGRVLGVSSTDRVGARPGDPTSWPNSWS